MASGSSRSPRFLLILLFYVALTVVFVAPVSLRPQELAVNDGDPLHISWILAWDAHQLPRQPWHLFDSNSFYPYPNSLAFSEHMIVQAVLSAPIWYLTGNALLGQNVAVLLALSLSGFAMFLLAREVVRRSDAAVVAGVVYAFHTYHFHETARMQLLSVEWWPLALLHLHRLFVGGKSRNAALFGLFFTLQGLSCTYYLFYFLLALAVWIPGYLLFVDRSKAKLLAAPLGASGLVFALFAIPYVGMLRNFNYTRGLAEGVDLLEYIHPPDGSPLSPLLGFQLPKSVAPQYLGFASLALAAMGLVALRRLPDRRRRLFVWLSLATALLGFALSLGPIIRVGGKEWGPGPYALLYQWVPLFRVLRNAERMSLLVRFGLAILSGLGAKVLFERASAFRPPALSAVRILTVVILYLDHFQGGQTSVLIPVGKRVPEVYRWLARSSEHGPVVELPLYPRERLRLHSLYMLYSTYHWRPIVFGRTSFYPPLTGFLAWQLRDFPDDDSIALLAGIGVEQVIVHPRLWKPTERGEKLALLRTMTDRLLPEGRFGPLEGRVFDRYGLGNERVFRLHGSGPPASAGGLCRPSDEIAPVRWKLSGDAATPLEWAIDRDPTTAFRTHGQLPGLKLQVDLARVETISAVRLAIGHPYDQFPRDLTLKASRPGETFARVDYEEDLATKWEVVRSLIDDPSHAAITLRFPPIEADRLRFWVREGKGFDYALPDWSLPELYLYRRCDLPARDSRSK